MRRAPPALAQFVMPFLALSLVALLLACGDGDPPATPSSTATAAASGTSGATATPELGSFESLRDVDFADPAIVGPLIDAAGGGEVLVERVSFHELTGDDVEEAVVPVESGGTLGDLGAGVFTLVGGQPELVQFIEAAGRIEVRLDLVVAIEGVWAAADPGCCPSQLRETSYQWDGARFAAITEQVLPNPDP